MSTRSLLVLVLVMMLLPGIFWIVLIGQDPQPKYAVSAGVPNGTAPSNLPAAPESPDQASDRVQIADLKRLVEDLRGRVLSLEQELQRRERRSVERPPDASEAKLAEQPAKEAVTSAKATPAAAAPAALGRGPDTQPDQNAGLLANEGAKQSTPLRQQGGNGRLEQDGCSSMNARLDIVSESISRLVAPRALINSAKRDEEIRWLERSLDIIAECRTHLDLEQRARLDETRNSLIGLQRPNR